MRLNSNGNIRHFYYWSYNNGHLPTNLCPFFWKLLIAVILFPLTWWTYPFQDIGIVMRTFVGSGIWFIAGAVAAAIAFALGGDYTGLIVLGAAFAVPIIIIGIGLLGVIGEDVVHWTARSETYREVRDIVYERKESFKDKYCPRIEWE